MPDARGDKDDFAGAQKSTSTDNSDNNTGSVRKAHIGTPSGVATSRQIRTGQQDSGRLRIGVQAVSVRQVTPQTLFYRGVRSVCSVGRNAYSFGLTFDRSRTTIT